MDVNNWLHEQGRLIYPALDFGRNPIQDKLCYKLFPTITLEMDDTISYHDRCLVIEQMVEFLEDDGWLYVACPAWNTNIPQQLHEGEFSLMYENEDTEIWGWQKQA